MGLPVPDPARQPLFQNRPPQGLRDIFRMSFLTLTNIQKSFGPVQVVKDFNMGIEKGEFVSFLGPSGCGKTTILRMIAGFETPTGGTIQIGGKSQDNLKPNQRNI